MHNTYLRTQHNNRTRTQHLVTAGLLSLVSGLFLTNPALAVGDSDNDGSDDTLDTFPCRANVASVQHFPAENQHALLMYEDQWPASGDNDFNDVLVSYNERVYRNASNAPTRFELSAKVLAVGGVFRNGLAIRLPVPAGSAFNVAITENGTTRTVTPESGENELVIRLYDDVRSAFGNPADTVVNADPTLPARNSISIELVVDFNNGVTLNTAEAPFDIFLFRSADYTHQIHLPQYAGTTRMNASLFGTENDASTASKHFVNAQGLPFALHIPVASAHTREGRSIAALYPDIVTFASSGGAQQTDFFNRPVVAQSYTSGNNGVSRPSPDAVVALSNVTSCVTPKFIPGLRLWLDASDSSTITNNSGAASEWRDKSGNGATAQQSVAAQRPTITTNAINGKTALTFDGVNDWMPTLGFTGNIADKTMIVVTQLSALVPSTSVGATNFGGAVVSIEPRTFHAFDCIVYNEFARGRWSNGSDNAKRSAGTTGPNDETSLGALIISNRQTSADFRIIRNGTVQAQTAAFATFTIPNGRFLIGNRHTGGTGGTDTVANGFYFGKVAEVLFYDRALTQSELNQVHTYLASKWGVSGVATP